MRPEQIKNAVSKLGLSEKLLLVEDIWDSIAANNSEIPMSMWQKRELDRRYEEYKQGKLKLHNWDDVHNDSPEKYK
ncbi:addiction module protein [Methylococcaceae bacterium HT5]|nr:addiction module protein [Methylococcaceae bacterium HT5]